jgi:hypothetical protein
MFVALIVAVLVGTQPEPGREAGPPTDTPPSSERKAEAPATAAAWKWKVNEAHRYRTERATPAGTETITYKLVIRVHGEAEFKETLKAAGFPEADYAAIIATIEEVRFVSKDGGVECETTDANARPSTIRGKLYQSIKGAKAGFIADQEGRVIDARSAIPQAIAHAQTGDAGSIIDEVELGLTFSGTGLEARFAEIMSTLAAPVEIGGEIITEPVARDEAGGFTARSLKRTILPPDAGSSVIRIKATGSVTLSHPLAGPDGAGKPMSARPAAEVAGSLFEREVQFSPAGYVSASSGSYRLNEAADAVRFRVERLPSPPPEPPYIPRDKRPEPGPTDRP